eukprot:1252605-Prymnesium_polylepis.1
MLTIVANIRSADANRPASLATPQPAAATARSARPAISAQRCSVPRHALRTYACATFPSTP